MKTCKSDSLPHEQTTMSLPFLIVLFIFVIKNEIKITRLLSQKKKEEKNKRTTEKFNILIQLPDTGSAENRINTIRLQHTHYTYVNCLIMITPPNLTPLQSKTNGKRHVK